MRFKAVSDFNYVRFSFFRSPHFLTLLLGIHVVCYVLALPLFEWKGLIFPSLAAILLPVLFRRRLPGRHPYWKIWAFGTLFWICEAHYIRYPHPINNVLMLALAAYLGCYLPLFTAVSRNIVHRKLPRVLYPLLGRRVFSSSVRTLTFLFVVSIVWAACDVLRGWIFSGFMLASVADVFYRTPLMIQTADLAGQWGTSALFVFLSAALTVVLFEKKYSSKFAAFTAFFLASVFLVGYGAFRLAEPNPNAPVGNIALIQGCIPSELSTTPELVEKTEREYLKLAQKTYSETEADGTTTPHVDLVVFPECIYRYPIIFAEKNAFQPQGLLDENDEPISADEFQKRAAQIADVSQENLRFYVQNYIKTSFLAGCSICQYTQKDVRYYNSAILVPFDTQEVRISNAYHKMILVPFGEYIPVVRALQKFWPSLESMFPIGSLNSGESPAEIVIPLQNGDTLSASMSLCFESVLGRLTRRQIATLRRRDCEPDCIINLTNNGWFGYSNENRLHLACGVFRAIENRKPFLVAANYGISASISSNGCILSEVPTGKSDVLYAHVQRDSRRTIFTEYGGYFLWIPLLFLFWGMWNVKRRPKKQEKNVSPN